MSANAIPCKYEGQVITFSPQGWINATVAAARFGREPNEWLVQRETVAYLCALAKALGKSGYVQELRIINQLPSTGGASRAKVLRLCKKTGLVRTKAGACGGTWLHPKLAVAFARWLSADFAVWCDLQIESLVHGGEDGWRQLRNEAAVGHKGLCDALNLSRAEEGKPTKPYHYMNEAKLINGVLFGEFRRRDREAMTAAELNMVAMLEQRDTFLIGRGLDYQARKKALTQYAQQLQTKLIQNGRNGGEVA
ncbi:KilA-N domain-containing protein [Halomonas alkalisoli]|uniref:KilA-N domain-containing protein n=1 Tax=Halomonas alkalisoli TaxID=2907158 RepID=UPI001F2CFC03|nr:KilA-N domain-containing protein [Halomonas alkalisoli]MCE9681948.1 KilA-N domain-containing protein [Halomonas alkalisoli]